MKGKTGDVVSDPPVDCDNGGGGGEGAEVSQGRASWSKHCMSGISLCFKVE